MTLFSGDNKALRFFVKVDPSSENWAPMKLDFECNTVSAVTTTGHSVNVGTSSSTNTVSYGVGTGPDWTDVGTYPSGQSAYVPNGGQGVGAPIRG
jgi:hypothetical protein